MKPFLKDRGDRLFAFLLVIQLIAIAGQTGQAQAEVALERTDNGQAIAVRDLEGVLSQSGVVARMSEGERLGIFGTVVETKADSTVFLALSSQQFVAACIDGTIAVGSNSAEPGQVVIVRFDEPAPQTFYFDAERFLATSSLAQNSKIRSSLEAVAASHRRLKFWGLLEDVGTNARAPVSPGIEDIRSSYLLTPTVVSLRSEAAGDQKELARLVAERFLGGLAARDLEPVESLLDPQLFQGESGPYDRDTWQILRSRFAEAMISGQLAEELAESSIEALKDQKQFRVVGKSQTFTLSLTEFDDMFFIHALEPKDELS